MKRTKYIKIRVNDAEHKIISSRGKRSGGISKLVRDILLNEQAKDLRLEAIRELIRLARNINLIARAVSNFPPERAVQIIVWLMNIDRNLSAAIGKISSKRSEC